MPIGAILSTLTGGFFCPPVTSVGYTGAAAAQASGIIARGAADIAIQVGVALWQRNSSKSISNMQTDLADQQMRLAERVQAHAILFWPEERELVNDIFSETRANAEYALGTGWGAVANATLADARLVWLETSRQECFTPDRCDDARWQRNATMNQVDLTSYGFRQAEARMEILRDRRYARQLAVLGLGRGLASTLTSYQGVSQYSGLSAGAMIESGINSALSEFGYFRGRRLAGDGWGTQSSLQQVYAPGTVGAPVRVSPSSPQRPEAITSAASDSMRATSSPLYPAVPTALAVRREAPSKMNASREMEAEADLRRRIAAEDRRGYP